MDLDTLIGNSLVDMHSKCRELYVMRGKESKVQKRKNVVAWGAMISSYEKLLMLKVIGEHFVNSPVFLNYS